MVQKLTTMMDAIICQIAMDAYNKSQITSELVYFVPCKKFQLPDAVGKMFDNHYISKLILISGDMQKKEMHDRYDVTPTKDNETFYIDQTVTKDDVSDQLQHDLPVEIGTASTTKQPKTTATGQTDSTTSGATVKTTAKTKATKTTSQASTQTSGTTVSQTTVVVASSTTKNPKTTATAQTGSTTQPTSTAKTKATKTTSIPTTQTGGTTATGPSSTTKKPKTTTTTQSGSTTTGATLPATAKTKASKTTTMATSLGTTTPAVIVPHCYAYFLIDASTYGSPFTKSETLMIRAAAQNLYVYAEVKTHVGFGAYGTIAGVPNVDQFYDDADTLKNALDGYVFGDPNGDANVTEAVGYLNDLAAFNDFATLVFTASPMNVIDATPENRLKNQTIGCALEDQDMSHIAVQTYSLAQSADAAAKLRDICLGLNVMTTPSGPKTTTRTASSSTQTSVQTSASASFSSTTVSTSSGTPGTSTPTVSTMTTTPVATTSTSNSSPRSTPTTTPAASRTSPSSLASTASNPPISTSTAPISTVPSHSPSSPSFTTTSGAPITSTSPAESTSISRAGTSPSSPLQMSSTSPSTPSVTTTGSRASSSSQTGSTTVSLPQCKAFFFIDASKYAHDMTSEEVTLLKAMASTLYNYTDIQSHVGFSAYGDGDRAPEVDTLSDSLDGLEKALGQLVFYDPDGDANVSEAVADLNKNADFDGFAVMIFTNSPQPVIDAAPENHVYTRTIGLALSSQNMGHIAINSFDGDQTQQAAAMLRQICLGLDVTTTQSGATIIRSDHDISRRNEQQHLIYPNDLLCDSVFRIHPEHWIHRNYKTNNELWLDNLRQFWVYQTAIHYLGGDIWIHKYCNESSNSFGHLEPRTNSDVDDREPLSFHRSLYDSKCSLFDPSNNIHYWKLRIHHQPHDISPVDYQWYLNTNEFFVDVKSGAVYWHSNEYQRLNAWAFGNDIRKYAHASIDHSLDRYGSFFWIHVENAFYTREHDPVGCVKLRINETDSVNSNTCVYRDSESIFWLNIWSNESDRARHNSSFLCNTEGDVWLDVSINYYGFTAIYRRGFKFNSLNEPEPLYHDADF
ncbi:unnamed protein product, partial [Mesorhabditis spiculigera]